jgi:hypothetical protein
MLVFSLLILGLLFSTTLGFKFNLSQGFEFKGFWISLPIQLFDFAVKSSNELSLTSQLIGYLIYLIFGILCLKRFDLSIKTNMITFIIFCGLIGIVFLSDFYSFYQDLNNQFTGRHFRIGLTVFLLGLTIFYRLNTNKVSTEIRE